MATLPVLLPAALNASGKVSVSETVLFVVVAIITVVCGFGLLTAKRAVHAAVHMIAIMIGLAVLYIANEAPFLGITQVVVYTGAVMTLVLFVIMLVGVGGDEPVGAGRTSASAWIVGIFGLGLVILLASAALHNTVPAAVGLSSGAQATPAQLAAVLFGSHVVAMELTGLLLIVAATGALALTHRQRTRPKVTQRSILESKMRAYAQQGTHPGQKPMPGIYAATNAATAPALAADGHAIVESVPRTLRVRGQELELAEVSPEYAAAARSGRCREEDANLSRSGMPAMPGQAAPVVTQPLAPASTENSVEATDATSQEGE